MSDIFDALPPGPFAYMTTAPAGEHEGRGHVYIIDATGRKIGVCWGPPDTKLATVRMIIRARDWADTPEGRAAIEKDTD